MIDLPKNLGGPQAVITEIETVLCGYAPCSVPLDPARYDFNYDQPVTVAPLPGAKPFFINPTSCKPAISTLQGWSWLHPEVTASKTSTDVVNNQIVPSFTPTGCENVPFDAHVSMTPTETDAAGQPSAEQVAIDYGHDFADDPIWQSALRNADVTLPDGMALSPGGGVGLEGCDYDQFGVDPARASRSTTTRPRARPGSQIGTLNVSTARCCRRPARRQGLLRLHRPSADQPCLTTPGRPTPANPWKLFLLIEGAGLRIKLAGDVTRQRERADQRTSS